MGLKYIYSPPSSDNRVAHIWSVVGDNGGVHIHARLYSMPGSESEYLGGVEVHSKAPMYDGQPVSHSDCWLIGCPCYHDGTSLYFSEQIAPRLRGGPEFADAIHEMIYSELFDWYQQRLARGEA